MYVSYNAGETWVEEKSLHAADGAANDQFGTVVAIRYDTIVVGVQLDDNIKGTNAGSCGPLFAALISIFNDCVNVSRQRICVCDSIRTPYWTALQ